MSVLTCDRSRDPRGYARQPLYAYMFIAPPSASIPSAIFEYAVTTYLGLFHDRKMTLFCQGEDLGLKADPACAIPKDIQNIGLFGRNPRRVRFPDPARDSRSANGGVFRFFEGACILPIITPNTPSSFGSVAFRYIAAVEANPFQRAPLPFDESCARFMD